MLKVGRRGITEHSYHRFLRHHTAVLALPFLPTIGRPDRDNTIDLYLSDEPEEVLDEGCWQRYFTSRPDALTKADKRDWLSEQTGVSLAATRSSPSGTTSSAPTAAACATWRSPAASSGTIR